MRTVRLSAESGKGGFEVALEQTKSFDIGFGRQLLESFA